MFVQNFHNTPKSESTNFYTHLYNISNNAETIKALKHNCPHLFHTPSLISIS